MKILFIINALEIGGAETFLLRLIQALKEEHGVMPFLYCLKDDSKDPEFKKLFLQKTEVTVLPTYKEPSNLFNFLGWKLNALTVKLFKYSFFQNNLNKKQEKYFKSFFIKNKIDLINSFLVASDIFTAKYLDPLLSIPHVITMQGCYDTIWDTKNNCIINDAKYAISCCSAMTYVAEKNLLFIKMSNIEFPKIMKQIYNGMPKPDIDCFKKRIEFNLMKDDFIVGQISRSIESKGMEIAINALISLVELRKFSHIKLFLIGTENSYYNYLKNKYADKNYIFFLGETYNSIQWAGLFDIGILPTYFSNESCPSSIIEYIACGKPVVSTTIGEIPKMIESDNEKAGILVGLDERTGKPDVDKIADAIMQYYLNKELFNGHSLLALKAFSRFNIAKTAKEYLEVYNKVLNKS